jgi:hypothetical protein
MISLSRGVRRYALDSDSEEIDMKLKNLTFFEKPYISVATTVHQAKMLNTPT